MAVFGAVIEPFVRPVIQARRNLSPGSTLKPQLIRDDPFGTETETLQQPAQQLFRVLFVPFRLEDLVEHVVMLTDSTPKPSPASRDFHNNSIEMPYIAWTALPPSQALGVQRSEPDDPTTDCRVRRIDPTLQQHSLNFAQPQIEA